MFGKKKNDKAISNAAAVRRKNDITNEEQIESFSGDVGTMEVEKNKINEKAKKQQQKKKKNKIKDIIGGLKIDRTVQDAIPYLRVYRNGIIEVEPGYFTKTYPIVDTNFRTTTQDRQDEMYLAYGDLLNYFDPTVRAEITIFNRSIDKEKFKEDTLFEEKDDKYNVLRKDMNEVLLSKISEGQSNITQDKYLTVTVKADNIELANATFGRVDSEISAKIKVINEAATDPMSLEDRLALLYNIYNQDTEIPFFKKANIDGNEARSFDLEWMQKLGLTTKDIIGPISMEFSSSNYFRIGEKYARTLVLRALPTQLSAYILTDISNVPCNALTSIHFAPMRQDEAIKLVRNQMLEINRNMAQAAAKASAKGLGESMLSPDLQQAKKDADKSYEDITVRDQKNIIVTLLVTVFADDLDDLNKFSKMVQNSAESAVCKLNVLSSMQKIGFNSCLPLGKCYVHTDQLINTEAAALFIPFESQELVQAKGLYYGVNATSRNLIMINRLRGQNSNALILGMPGSGKSFSAKMEMTQVFLSDTKNEIFVIDPQAEYRPLCESLGGQVVRIAPSSDTHINPFDLDISDDSKDGDDPITVKSDYICSICESAVGGHYGLNPVQVSVIDRCVRTLYEDYIIYMNKVKMDWEANKEENIKNNIPLVTCDRTKSPTLQDFYRMLKKQPEPEAEYIALAMEKYCTGSYNTFAFHTNVETNNRFVVYDIKDIGTGMNEMGMQICLNDIWARTIANKARGIRTWVYIDELYILTQSESCARFLMFIFKQIRKFGGAPTGITQNVEDLLTNRESRGIINNCSFITMLNQSNEDRLQIGAMLHISEAQLNYIKNADSGQGLIYSGKAIVPFINKFPKNNKLYDVISTNPNEQPVVI